MEDIASSGYDAYGHAQASPYADGDGDGLVGLAELNLVVGAFGTGMGDSGYKVEADFNADGAINMTDLNIQSGQSGESIARGRLSGSGNIVGYAGYIFEPATGMYMVRHRWYSTENGRWLSKDPAGYVDGQSKFLYALAAPIRYLDPLGLEAKTFAECCPSLMKCLEKMREVLQDHLDIMTALHHDAIFNLGQMAQLVRQLDRRVRVIAGESLGGGLGGLLVNNSILSLIGPAPVTSLFPTRGRSSPSSIPAPSRYVPATPPVTARSTSLI